VDDRTRSRVVGGAAALLLLAVVWHVVSKIMASAPARPTVVSAAPQPDSVAPATSAASRAGTATQGNDAAASGGGVGVGGGPSYFDLLARSEMRRRIRASAGVTYLNEIVAASQDSSLHRWDNRLSEPVREYLAPSTVANFQPVFLDAVKAAFARWEGVGVPVRFTFITDSLDNAEVKFRWRIQFETERTGQTDVMWDGDGHLETGTVTIATFDPKGQPLGPDDVRVVALHEVGHLLGLDHSPDSTDIMFATGGARDLSQRDIQTALLLYQLIPGSLK
jgi:hypothetical protein